MESSTESYFVDFIDENITSAFNLITNSTANSTNISSEQSPDPDKYIEQLRWAYALDSYGEYYKVVFPITFIVCVFGIVTNSLNMIIFTRKSMVNSVNIFLSALTVSNIALMLSQLPYTIHYFSGFKTVFNYHYVQFDITLVYLETASIIISNWLAVIVAVWMFLAIQFPLKVRVICSVTRTRIVLVISVLCGVLLASVVYLILKPIEYQIYGRTLYAKGFSDFALKNDKLYLKMVWGGALLFTLVPSIFLVICTAMLITSLFLFNLRRKERFSSGPETKVSRLETQNYRIAVMLSVILVLFILNNLPDAALTVVTVFTEGDEEAQKKSKKATDLLRMFSNFNSAVAFFIYYYMGENFRKTFKEVFCTKWNSRMSNDNKSLTSSSNASLSSRKNSVQTVVLTRIDTKCSTAQILHM